MKSIVGAENVFSVDAKSLYEARKACSENMYEEFHLTESEKEYWREKVLEIETPFIYEYTYGSGKIMIGVYTCSVLMMLFVAVALLPANVLAVWSLFDCRLVPFFGGYLTNLQSAPIAYVLITALLIFMGKLIHEN